MNAQRPTRRSIRCAIYTRKSSEEGLDQDFNSLDAQYEACAAYIASQKHEGWSLSPERYDDGGVSGGTLERASLQRLLGDIDAGRVQMIVVYKIDRLTRSLSDFARLIERLEAAGCSFVSVTQAFNTSTSMGRLTLNVLLSFAQFEREVTAERIRDKLAASKKKGMWMGGVTPLGYDARDRALHVNEQDARTVREVFALYRQHRSLARVEDILNARGVSTKLHTFATGRTLGGGAFTRGRLHHLLSNPIYIGKIRHHGALYEGRHDAIIDMGLWDEVQAILAASAASTGHTRQRQRRDDTGPARTVSSPLSRKITDETGDRLTPSHTVKTGKRYRYYVSSRTLAGADTSGDGWRLPAGELERAVANCAADALRDPQAASRVLIGATAARLTDASKTLQSIADELCGDHRAAALNTLITSVRVAPGSLQITLDASVIADRLSADMASIAPEALTLETGFTCRKRGVETRIVLADGSARPDRLLIQSLSKAHLWWSALRTGISMKDLADQEGVSQRRVANILTLAFLAPDITEAIVQGRQPAWLTADALIRNPIPLLWSEQREALIARHI